MKASKKLIGAIVALVAALAVSVGSTFAWFTEQNTAKVKAITLQVQSATGNLYIGTESGKLGQSPVTIDTSSVESTGLKDVTTDDYGVSFKDHSKGSATTGFLSFDLYFMSTTAVNLYLCSGSTITCSPNANNDMVINDTTVRSKIANKYGTEITDGKIAANAANAARVAFLDNDGSPVASNVNIWDPNKDAGYSTGNLAADYETYVNDTSNGWPESGAAASSVTSDFALCTSAKDAGTGTVIIELVANVEKKITVKIWLEGTDGDCMNSIFEDTIVTTLVFAGIEAGD